MRDPSRYVGRFRSGCFAHQWLTRGSADGPAVMVQAEFTVNVADRSSLQLDMRQHLFAPGDLQCEGPLLGIESSDIFMEIDSRATTVDQQGQSLPAARIRVSYHPPRGLSKFGAEAQVVEGVYYPAGYFTGVRHRRYLLLLIGEGMYFGTEEREKDAEGYPIFLEHEPGAVRF